jgi:predicted  nucleic acid-binding Zn-ribbon protein
VLIFTPVLRCYNSKFRVTARTRHDDLPATVGLVKEVRAELVAKITSVDHKIASVDVEALEQKMESRFEQVLAVVHRTQTLMEEQRNENRIVLDGIKAISERQDRAEERLDGFEPTRHVLVKAKNRTTT